MNTGIFAQDFFCRLCAAEGIVIHPLFPPGDDDPKDELVRMIEVLTSVHLTQVDDAGAVICDKCLQMLDLFCKFREECLRQDVLIRTRRVLLAEQLEQQRQQELLLQQEQQQQQTFFNQQQTLSILQPAVEVKVEETDDVSGLAQPIAADEPEEIVCTPIQQLVEIEDCKEEETPNGSGPFLIPNESPPCAVENQSVLQPYCQSITNDSIFNSSLNANSTGFPLAGVALISPSGILSIAVPISQPSPDATEALVDSTEGCDVEESMPELPVNRVNTQPNFKKPRPNCKQCKVTFATHYAFQQHMNQKHAGDKGNRGSLACDPCQMRFTKTYNLKRHMYEVHGEVPEGLTVIPCEHCGQRFLRGNILERHIERVHRNKKHHKVRAIKIN